VTLRRRVENGRSCWQLKLPVRDGRLEVEAEGGPRPPREIQTLITAHLAGRPLEEVATMRTRRRGVRVRSGDASADVVADEVALLEGAKEVGGFDELEVELVEGDESLLDALERRLHAAGASPGSGRVKLERALGVARPSESSPAREAPPLEHLIWHLRRQYEEIVRNDPGVRLGVDPEAVHDLRVACRRLRALLRAARPLLAPEWSRPLRDELKWLAGELGPLRDADVFLAYLRSESGAFEGAEADGARELVSLVETERVEAHAKALTALGSKRYLELLRELERTARAPRVRSASASLREIARGEHGRLRREARSVRADSSDDQLHELRILGKRARYAAELAERSEGKRARRYLKAAKRFQDVVGEHQDAAIAEAHLRSLEERCGRAGSFAAGRLVERQHERRRSARAELRTAWRSLDRAGRKVWS
jgi:CHAD domain-containing protein